MITPENQVKGNLLAFIGSIGGIIFYELNSIVKKEISLSFACLY